MAIGDPPQTGVGASQLVTAGWDYFRARANALLLATQESLDSISAPLLDMPAPTITYSPPSFDEGTFIRPVAPAMPAIPNIDVAVPDAPTLAPIVLDPLPAMPDEPDFSGMVYRQPTAPNVAVPARPDNTDVVLADIVIPEAPAHVMPELPSLYDITLPDIPDLAIPLFTGQRPTLNLQAPTEGLNWQYQPYDTGLIDTIKSQLSAMTINGLALPPEVEQAIFDRARGREDVLSEQQVSEASRALAARGLRQPAGLMTRTLDRIRTAARITSSGASRDIAIEISRQNVESIRFGLSQAIALESTLLQNHLQQEGLILDAAKSAHAALISIFEGHVALHNAQWEGFKAEAQVFGERIRALAAQADIVKTRVDAEKVKADVNEGLVRAYGESVRAVAAMADMHRSQVEAARAAGEINVQRLEQVRLRLQVHGQDIDSYSKQWEAYRIQADAEANGIRYFEALGNVFGQRVSAHRGQVEAQNLRTQSQIAVHGQQLDSFRSTLAGIATRVQAQSANVEAITRVFQSRAAMFGTEGQVSAAESAAGDRTAQLRMEQGRLLFDAAARNAEIASNHSIKRAELAIEGHRGSAQVWGQLAASVLSGVNMGASTSYGESMGWSWSGEI